MADANHLKNVFLNLLKKIKMALEIKGKLVKVLPKVTGEGNNGTWEKQEFVIETGGQYPQKVCFLLWGDKVNMLKNLKIGDSLNVGFDIESREYQERWFTNAKAWKIDVDTQAPPATPAVGDEKAADNDDLPF